MNVDRKCRIAARMPIATPMLVVACIALLAFLGNERHSQAASPSNRLDEAAAALPPAPVVIATTQIQQVATPGQTKAVVPVSGSQSSRASINVANAKVKGAGNIAGAVQPGWCSYPQPKAKPAGGAVAGGVVVVAEVEPNDSPVTAQLLPHGDGVGESRNIDVTGQINPSDDSDYYRVSTTKGDILGLAALGGNAPDTILRITDLAGNLIVENDDHFEIADIYPPGSPFPGGDADFDSILTWVVPASGDYLILVASFEFNGPVGSYTLQIRSSRPAFELQSAPATQIVFLDFDGETINALALFGIGNSFANLSSLSNFLPGWGLAGSENAVIDAIIAAIEENFDDLRIAALNGDRDVDGIDGHFDIEFRNSRDDDDPFGDPNVSRVIIGGTTTEIGFDTIGIAQFIDPGNFGGQDTAVVLLDFLSAPAGDPSSVNTIPRAPGVSILDAVGLVVGNIVDHEIGHYLGNWHTENENSTRCIMDQGGGDGIAQNIAGVGPDGVLGTADDVDPGFVSDSYEFDEPIGVGIERTDVRTAFGLATGAVGGQGCTVECDPGALAENEPDCGLPVDTTNGGCNLVPAVFTPIACGDTFCGTAAFEFGKGARDTDWYEVVLEEDTIVSWSVTAEFDVVIGILDNGGVDDCADVAGFLVATVGAPCETVTVEQALPPGTWWFFVAPDITDVVDCGAEYQATLECSGCDPTPNDVIFVRAFFDGPEFDDEIVGDHIFGSIQVFDSVVFPGAGFTVLVSSGPSSAPGFDWRTTMDFANFGIEDFSGGSVTLQLQDISSPITLSPISDVTVRDAFGGLLPGSGFFDFGNIEWNLTVNELIAGGGAAIIHWAQSCPAPCKIISSVPSHCAVDARQPHDRNDPLMRQGWDSIRMELECPTEGSLPTSIGEFMLMSDTAPTPKITSVDTIAGGIVDVFFDPPIPAGGWTCLTHIDSGEKVCIGSLPADVNGSGMSTTRDILDLIACLNGLNNVAGFDCIAQRTDMDRSNDTGSPDILRVIDLLNGAAEFEVWLDRTIGPCP